MDFSLVQSLSWLLARFNGDDWYCFRASLVAICSLNNQKTHPLFQETADTPQRVGLQPAGQTDLFLFLQIQWLHDLINSRDRCWAIPLWPQPLADLTCGEVTPRARLLARGLGMCTDTHLPFLLPPILSCLQSPLSPLSKTSRLPEANLYYLVVNAWPLF